MGNCNMSNYKQLNNHPQCDFVLQPLSSVNYTSRSLNMLQANNCIMLHINNASFPYGYIDSWGLIFITFPEIFYCFIDIGNFSRN